MSATDLAELLESGSAERQQDGQITIQCPDCPEKLTGNEKGRNSATWKLGRHRYAKHGKRGEGKPKLSAVGTEQLVDRPVAGNVRAIREVMGSGKGAPSADQLAAGLGRGFGLLTVGVASIMVDTDPNIPDGPDGEQLRSQLVEYLSLSDDAARGIMAPVGRIFHRTSLNEKYGRSVVENSDVVASAFDLAQYGMHLRRYLAMRYARRAENEPPAGGVTMPAPTGAIPTGIPPRFDGTNGSAPPAAGMVIDADTVQRMRAANG